MKKLIFIMIVAFVPALLLAQGTPLSSLYDRYVSDPGFTTTEILPGSMSFDWEKTMDNGQVKEMLQDIESIRILKYKVDEKNTDQDKIWKKMQKAASDDLYTEVVNVNAEDVTVNIYIIKGLEGNTREIALMVKNKEGVMMATITGNMDFSKIFSADNMQSLREMGEYFMHNKGECNRGEQ